MKIIKITDKNAKEEALECLRNGGILIYPTETAYGVGVNATNETAVTKLLEYKQRPSGKAISIGCANQEMADLYVDINSEAKNLYKNFLPGALTIVSKSKGKVDSRLESENGNLGIRIPNYKFLLDLISSFKFPITTTSANSSGKKTPYSVKDILDNLTEKQKSLIDLIIDAGEIPHNPPSTVIDTTTTELTIHRSGRIDPKKIKIQDSRFMKEESDTINFGFEFMKKHLIDLENGPLLILLNGELGAGKTHFTKGIAKALGINQVIKSPTYTYVNEYSYVHETDPRAQSAKLYHLDAWRIQTKEDLQALGFYEWFQESNIIVVEWPSVVMNLDEAFFENIKYFYIDFLNLGETQREIRAYQKTN
jgi:L-threonylcarbamoyladenylate synthase